VPYTVSDRAENSYCSVVQKTILTDYHDFKKIPQNSQNLQLQVTNGRFITASGDVSLQS